MHPMPRGYARYVLAVMVGINFLNYLDRYILPAVLAIIVVSAVASSRQVLRRARSEPAVVSAED